ncbi:MAG: hypothetical protein MEBIL_02246 [Bilophila sp.]
MKKNFIVIIALLFLTGCSSNGFNKFYEGMDITELTKEPGYIVEDVVHVENLPDLPSKQIIQKMFSQCYDFIGFSSWEGPGNEGDKEAIEQAKKIGASYVLWRADYLRTQQGTMPITTYNQGGAVTTFHSGGVNSGSIFGTYSGTSTTYLPGTTEINYIPYSIDRYNYTGLFFAKFDAKVLGAPLGISLYEPDDDYKKRFDTNYGRLVIGVVNGSIAHTANILPGDIIMAINKIPFTKDFDLWRYGEENIIKIYRDGKTLEKKVYIDNI